MARCGHRTDRYLATHKSRLFSGLSGTVLEIGPGAGANLRHLSGKNIRWIGVEPNRYMRQYLEKESSRWGITIHVCSGAAEELPLETAAVDFVISTLVLCSVADQTAALREILRVLKPGGQFLFIEHVAAEPGSALRYVQRAVTPVWRRMGDGCNPDRQTRAALENAGFECLEIEEFSAPLPIVRPHIAGCAMKPQVSGVNE
ncbi:MAG: methyltransferase domain-containing protein [Bryobacteraceae bacterium]|nr:methyltransferase domain-containing protein [Bryobacteraceae bacterium]